MSFTQAVKITLFCFTGLIPPAILARGGKAKAAYKRALEHGKTCDIRVRVMLIGQDHAGKTSVKRSLKGEKFNRDEASTAGVQMDPPLLRVGVRPWKPSTQSDETTTVFDHKSAQLVARQLSGSSDELEESPTKRSSCDMLEECPVSKKSQANGGGSSGSHAELEEFHPQTSVSSNGIGSSQGSPHSPPMGGKYQFGLYVVLKLTLRL